MSIRPPKSSGSGPVPDARAAQAFPQIPAPREVAAALEAWFPLAARDLPWRRQRSGYRALVSEVMLQQTQVARVTGAFEGFLQRFPTPVALADASEDAVLAAWQGLGYYRRARLLHRAAQVVRDAHGGQVPADATALLTLPGVGRYTAGAIASIVHGAREPIVDGNVLRVLSRVAGAPTRAGDPASEAWAWEQATALVHACAQPAVLNEALMELGATVCVPGEPHCQRCPLAARCRAHAAGSAAEFPAPRKASARRTLWWNAVVDADTHGLLLEQRPERGLWARLWQPPTFESDSPQDAAAIASRWGAPLRQVGAFTHVTSHRDVQFCVFVPASASAGGGVGAGAQRVRYSDIASYALANAAWRVLELAAVPVTTPPSAAGNRRATRAARIVATDS